MNRFLENIFPLTVKYRVKRKNMDNCGLELYQDVFRESVVQVQQIFSCMLQYPFTFFYVNVATIGHDYDLNPPPDPHVPA